MRRFLFILDYYFKRWSSLDIFFARLARTYADNGHEVYIAVPILPVPSIFKHFIHERIKFVELTSWREISIDAKSKRFNLQAAKQLKAALEVDQFDLVALHHCSPVFAFLISYQFFLKKKVPCLVFHQHNEVKIPPNPIRKWISNRFSKLRILSLLCGKIVTVYEGGKSSLLKKGIAPKKIRVIHNGVDLDRFNYAQGVLGVYEEFDIPANWKIIVFVGTLIPTKGLAELFEAIKKVLRSVPETALLLVGEGSMRIELENRTHDLNLNGHIFWAGRRSDIPRILQAADLLVLPSHTEGFSLVNIEAGAARIPVVATRVGGSPEVVIDKVCGLLVEPKNTNDLAKAIVCLLRDDILRKAMGANLRKRVETCFSIDSMLNNYINLYDSLVFLSL